LAHGLIKKSEYWQFVEEAQPWISNNVLFVGIVEEKLKYFAHDDEHYMVTNFDYIYQRVKGLIENFSVKPQKLEGIFTRPAHKTSGSVRAKRKDPETLILRRKLIRFKSRQKIERRWRKNPYGMRSLTKLKYQTMKYQIEAADGAFEMRQVFRKKPSHHHQA
jgi:chromatin segregation and condensation protein Rec8/ScpA/Scc1 (kleisin family)